MASLLDLTSQGDVATITDDAYLNRTLQLMEPQQLYELWERQHWQSQAIDLERDKEQWAELSDEDREEHLWGLSSFFVGEERVTTQFSGLVMAYENEQEEAFLTTQQVDEARHMQFFDRWFREVAGIDGGIKERLAASRVDVTDAFVELFDERLVKMGERLIADPSDMDAKVDFITNYHMVIEGTLALTGQHFMLDYYEKNDLLPGFAEGFAEHRPRRAPPRGLRHLVPPAEVRRGALPDVRAGDAQRAAAARGGRARAEGLRGRGRLQVLRLHRAGAGRVRLQRAVAAPEGDRRAAGYSHRLSSGSSSLPRSACMQSSAASVSGKSVRWWAPRLSSRARQAAPIRRASG